MQPFDYAPAALEQKCSNMFCCYQADLAVTVCGLRLCRICLGRMRATLKLAEKTLPRPPKVPRPAA